MAATPLEDEPPVADRRDLIALEQAGWPTTLPATSYALLRQAADRFGAAPALSFFLDATRHRTVRRWSYRALFAEVTRAANLFTRLGIGPRDVVAYILPNLPETHFVLWGAEAAGIALAINPLLDPSAIRDILRAARARVVVTLAPFPGTELYARTVAAVEGVDTVGAIVTVAMTGHVAGWRRLPARAMAWTAARRAAAPPPGVAVHPYARLRRRAPADRLLRGDGPAPDDTASYFCTGGTTGLPKIAVRTHANEVANAWMSTRMGGNIARPGDVMFCGLPLFHVNAAMVTGLAAFLRGAHVLIGTPQGYRAPGLIDRLWEIVEHHRLACFSGVPTLYAALLQKPVGGHDLSSLRYVFCGAAPMPADQIRAFEAMTGVPILEGYGLTEGTCVSVVNPVGGERRPGSIGLPIPFQAVSAMILDDNGGFVRDAAVDEVGAIAIAGPNLFQGYLGVPPRWIDRGDGRRWFDTGDVGRIDGDGYVWLTGRTKDIIIRGGHNIDPATIEDALYRHPAVALAAAIGRPDPYAGEVPVAYVQLRARHSVDEAALLAFAEAQVGERAARPKAVHVIDAMPLTAVGKIFKPTLREIETRRTIEAVLAAAGVAADVTVRQDARLGLVAAIDGPDSLAARAALAGYAITIVDAHGEQGGAA